MKFGVQHPSFSHDGTGPEIFESLKTVATQAERLGYDSFWVMDHLHQIQGVGNPDEPMLEGWTTIAALAGVTSRIRLGTLVTGNVYRHPSMVAKIGATLDVLSKGRLFMGIGAAWNVDESNAYGIPFPAMKERFERLEEAVQIIKGMWTEVRMSFDGKHYKLRNAYCNPKPIQKPHPPIMVGGGGEKQTLRIVAKYADACNLFGSPETVKRKLAVLRDHCKMVGRDHDSILKTKLGHVIIEKDQQRLDQIVAESYKGVSEEMRKEWGVIGQPEKVRRDIEAFRDAGVEYFISNFDAEIETQSLKLFADEVVQKF